VTLQFIAALLLLLRTTAIVQNYPVPLENNRSQNIHLLEKGR
jgi:hypothetical protein